MPFGLAWRKTSVNDMCPPEVLSYRAMPQVYRLSTSSMYMHRRGPRNHSVMECLDGQLPMCPALTPLAALHMHAKDHSLMRSKNSIHLSRASA